VLTDALHTSRPDRVHGATEPGAGLRGMPTDRWPVGASADVPELARVSRTARDHVHWEIRCHSSPESARKDRNLRSSARRTGPEQYTVLQAFRRDSRLGAARLKIVVSPVRVRISPFAIPHSSGIFFFSDGSRQAFIGHSIGRRADDPESSCWRASPEPAGFRRPVRDQDHTTPARGFARSTRVASRDLTRAELAPE
jgi:hypothetical protein